MRNIYGAYITPKQHTWTSSYHHIGLPGFQAFFFFFATLFCWCDFFMWNSVINNILKTIVGEDIFDFAATAQLGGSNARIINDDLFSSPEICSCVRLRACARDHRCVISRNRASPYWNVSIALRRRVSPWQINDVRYLGHSFAWAACHTEQFCFTLTVTPPIIHFLHWSCYTFFSLWTALPFSSTRWDK